MVAACPRPVAPPRCARPRRARGLAPGFELSAAVLRHLQADPLLPAELLPADWPGALLRSTYDGWDARYRATLRGVEPGQGRRLSGVRSLGGHGRRDRLHGCAGVEPGRRPGFLRATLRSARRCRGRRGRGDVVPRRVGLALCRGGRGPGRARAGQLLGSRPRCDAGGIRPVATSARPAWKWSGSGRKATVLDSDGNIRGGHRGALLALSRAARCLRSPSPIPRCGSGSRS